MEELDLTYISHPSPRGSKNREVMRKYVSEIQVPLLVDSEKEVVMLESDDICEYLEKNYGRK